MSNTQEIIDALTKSTSARWAYLQYRNSNNELSTYKLLLNADFMKMYQDDLKTLENMNVTGDVELKAKTALIESVKKAIATEFEHEKNPTKNMISAAKGIKFLPESQEFYLHCVSLEKKVIEPGQYKEVKSSELTLAKNKIKKELKQSKIRFFKINVNQISKITANGDRIVIKA